MYQYRNDNNITGWISPNGEFWGCEPYDHMNMARVDIGVENEGVLEERGWVKIYAVPSNLRLYGNTSILSYLNNEFDYFVFKPGTPTAKQIDVLESKGIPIHSGEWYS